MNWFAIDLGDAMLAQGRLTELEKQLRLAWLGAGQPDTMLAGVVSRSQGLHCQITLFLSGPLQCLVALPDAVPCQHLPADIQPLIGNWPNMAC